MIIHDGLRLTLYVLAGVFPIWADFFAKSNDFSVRGLAMPILSSLTSAVMIALAKTSSRMDARPVEVVAPKGEPLAVTETKPAKPKTK